MSNNSFLGNNAGCVWLRKVDKNWRARRRLSFEFARRPNRAFARDVRSQTSARIIARARYGEHCSQRIVEELYMARKR